MHGYTCPGASNPCGRAPGDHRDIRFPRAPAETFPVSKSKGNSKRPGLLTMYSQASILGLLVEVRSRARISESVSTEIVETTPDKAHQPCAWICRLSVGAFGHPRERSPCVVTHVLEPAILAGVRRVTTETFGSPALLPRPFL
jgi:hypothetical protein